MTTEQLLKKSLETIEALASKLATIKDMLPISHPAQNQAAFDLQDICTALHAAIRREFAKR